MEKDSISLKNQLTVLSGKIETLEQNLHSYRTEECELKAKIAQLKEMEKIEDNKHLINNYYKVEQQANSESKNKNILFLKVIDVRLDVFYEEEAVIVADTCEFSFNKNDLETYTFIKDNELSILPKYVIGEGINPKELIQITEKEFLEQKKV